MSRIQHETCGLRWKHHTDTVFKRQLIVPAAVHRDSDQPVLLGVNGQLHRLLPPVRRLPDAAKESTCLPHRRFELYAVEPSGQRRVRYADDQRDDPHDDHQLDEGDA